MRACVLLRRHISTKRAGGAAPKPAVSKPAVASKPLAPQVTPASAPKPSAKTAAPAASAAPAPPAPTLPALLAAHPLLLISTRYCSTCRDVAERLEDADVKFHHVVLTGTPECAALLSSAQAAHPEDTLTPFLFLSGVRVPTVELLASLRRPVGTRQEAAIAEKIRAAGVAAPGPWRP